MKFGHNWLVRSLADDKRGQICLPQLAAPDGVSWMRFMVSDLERLCAFESPTTEKERMGGWRRRKIRRRTQHKMSGEEIDRDNVRRRVNGDGGVGRLSEPHRNMNEPEGSDDGSFIPIS